jgi:hypothetical protein
MKNFKQEEKIEEEMIRIDKVVESIERGGLFYDMRNFFKKPGMVDTTALGYGYFSYPIVEEASSDECEDLFAEEDVSETNNDEFSDEEESMKPSVKLVCDKLIDKNIIMSIVNFYIK